jgi:hypothetical protein
MSYEIGLEPKRADACLDHDEAQRGSLREEALTGSAPACEQRATGREFLSGGLSMEARQAACARFPSSSLLTAASLIRRIRAR